MKNKKAMGFRMIVVAIISLVILFIVVGPIIIGIFVDKQIAFASGKTEELTTDCDQDGVIVGDVCPCDDDKKVLADLEGDQRCKKESSAICPTLCG